MVLEAYSSDDSAQTYVSAASVTWKGTQPIVLVTWKSTFLLFNYGSVFSRDRK